MYIPSVEEKVGNWVNAYRAIRDELTMPELRAAQDLMNRTEGMLVSSLAVARLIYATAGAAMPMPERRPPKDLRNGTGGILVSSLAVAPLTYPTDRAAAMTAAI